MHIMRYLCVLMGHPWIAMDIIRRTWSLFWNSLFRALVKLTDSRNSKPPSRNTKWCQRLHGRSGVCMYTMPMHCFLSSRNELEDQNTTRATTCALQGIVFTTFPTPLFPQITLLLRFLTFSLACGSAPGAGILGTGLHQAASSYGVHWRP